MSHSSSSEGLRGNGGPGLKRTLGIAALTFYGLGDMLGAGIYGLIGEVASVMGNAVWLAFVAAFFAAAFTGLSYASLGSRYPRAAGEAFITGRAFKWPILAYVVGLAVAVSGLVSMAAVSHAFAGYFAGIVGGVPSFVLIPLFVAVLAAINLRGIRESSWVNILCTTIEAGGLILIIIVGLRFWGSVNYLDVATAPQPAQSLSAGLVLSGAVITFFAFIGFEDLINVSEEVKNPRRTFPIALIAALVLAAGIYIAVSFSSISVVAPAALAQSPDPLVEVMRQAASWFPPILFSIVALFAVANTGLLNYVMSSRLVYGMARQGLLPEMLGRISPGRRTPHVAIVVLGAIVLMLALPGRLTVLAEATSSMLLFVFILVNASLLVLKYRAKDERGGFEVPAIVPVAGAIICAALIFHAQWRSLLLAAGLLAAIAILYLIMRPKKVIADDR